MKIALVGCGKMGSRHARVHQELGHDLVVIDADEEAASKFASGLAVVALPELKDALQSVDAVDVCTPTPFHSEHVVTALNAEKSVLCEKPLCMNMSEAELIKNAEADSAGFVMTGYLLRFHPVFEMARRLVADDLLGPIHLVQMRIGGRGGHVSWKHSADQGGGVQNEVLCHMIDLANWIFGPIVRAETVLSDQILKMREIAGIAASADCRDLILTKLQSGSGATILAQADMLSPGYMNHIEIHGRYGSLFTSGVPGIPTVLSLTEARAGIPAGRKTREFPPVDLLQLEISAFAEAVRGGKPCPIPLQDSVRVQQLLERLGAASLKTAAV